MKEHPNWNKRMLAADWHDPTKPRQLGFHHPFARDEDAAGETPAR